MTLLSSSPDSERGPLRLAVSGGHTSPNLCGSGGATSPVPISPADLLSAAAAAAQQQHQRQLAAAAAAFCGAPDTDGCCPTMPVHALSSAGSCGTVASGGALGADDSARKLAILGLPWETT
jgi:hypothetical protein